MPPRPMAARHATKNPPIRSPERLAELVRADALAEGFEVVAITRAEAAPETPARLRSYLKAGRHASMAWMAETETRRASPRGLWPEARSVIMLGMNYGPDDDPLEAIRRHDKGAISVYARGRDYHEPIKGKLKQIAGRLAARSGHEVKVFVDTAPVMEKTLAAAAGLGWQGKHTCLVSRSFGSWLFLGAIYTTAELPVDKPETDHCGHCRACLDICPTNAFPAPYQLDARRCISYLTIEHKGHIDPELRALMGNRIFGCDDCLAICPWNRFAKVAREARFHARDELRAPSLAELSCLDDAAFRALFTASPVKRIGRDRFIRNVLIAIGNSGEPALLARAEGLLTDASPLVRAMAVWAAARLASSDHFETLKAKHLGSESDEDVRGEWRAGGGAA